MIELEDVKTGVSITDLGLNDFRMDLLNYVKEHGELARTLEPQQVAAMLAGARSLRLADGPDEVHKVTVARQVLKDYRPHEVPSEHVPTRRKAAIEKFAEYLEGVDA